MLYKQYINKHIKYYHSDIMKKNICLINKKLKFLAYLRLYFHYFLSQTTKRM